MTSTSDQAKPVAIVKPLTFTHRMKALRIIHTPSGTFRMEGFGCWDRIPDSLVKHRRTFEKIGSKVFRRGFAVAKFRSERDLSFI